MKSLLDVTQSRTSVLIIGGYGTFGGRLAKLLADEEGLLLVVAGRSESKAALFRFPRTAASVPVTVHLTADDGTETWCRTFGGRGFESLQFEGRGRSARLLCERFGPFTFGLALVTGGDRLRLVVRRWQFLGVPLPAILAPYGDSFEHVDDGQFGFHVEICHPCTGLIVRYQGWLVPA